jgi:hypothetical protein
MAAGSSQPLTEMSIRNLPGGWRAAGRRVRLTNVPPPVSRLSRENMALSKSHKPMGLHGLLHKQLYLLRLISFFQCLPLSLFSRHISLYWLQDSSVRVETRLRAGRPINRGLIPDRGRKYFSSQLPDCSWNHPSSCQNGYEDQTLVPCR